MSSRIDRSWLVVESPENEDHDRCVDLFARGDGSFGFQEFRRDVEDRGVWTRVGYTVGQRYASLEGARAAALAAIPWLAEMG